MDGARPNGFRHNQTNKQRPQTGGLDNDLSALCKGQRVRYALHTQCARHLRHHNKCVLHKLRVLHQIMLLVCAAQKAHARTHRVFNVLRRYVGERSCHTLPVAVLHANVLRALHMHIDCRLAHTHSCRRRGCKSVRIASVCTRVCKTKKNNSHVSHVHQFVRVWQC